MAWQTSRLLQCGLKRVLEGALVLFAHIFDGLSSGWRLWQSVQLRWHTKRFLFVTVVRQKIFDMYVIASMDFGYFQGQLQRPDSLILLSANIGAYLPQDELRVGKDFAVEQLARRIAKLLSAPLLRSEPPDVRNRSGNW